MKRAQAYAALDAASNDYFSQAFRVFVAGRMSSVDGTLKRFESNFAALLKAHTQAQIVIERMIPPDKTDPDA